MKLDHINIVTPDVDATVRFFEDVLGLKTGFRPDFDFAGAWLYGEDEGPALVHLVEGPLAPGGTGPLDHVAFKSADMQALTDALDDKDVRYASRTVPGTGDRQVFFTAPFGLKIEVNFPPET